MKTESIPRLFALMTAIATAGACRPASASQNTGAAEPNRPMLAERYVSYRGGFSIRPPAGSVAVTGLPGVLVKFVDESQQTVMRISIRTSKRSITLAQFTAAMRGQLEALCNGFKLLKDKPMTICDRTGHLLVGRYRSKQSRGERLLQQAMVPLRDKQFYVISYSSPLKLRRSAERLFEASVDSFRILDLQTIARRQKQLLDEGAKLLSKLRLDRRTFVPGPTRYWRFKIGSKDVGFAEISETAGTPAGKPGLTVSTFGLAAPQQGQPMYVRGQYWTNAGLDSSGWRQELLQCDSPQPVMVETGRRKGEKIQLTISEIGRNRPKRKQLRLARPGAYLPQAMDYILWRMIELDKPRQFALLCYDQKHQRIGVRIIKLLGQVELELDGKDTKAYKVIDQLGLNGPTAEWYLDKDGRLIRRVCQNELIVPAEEAELRKIWPNLFPPRKNHKK